MTRLPFLVLGLLICSSAWGQSVAKPVITPTPGSYNNSVSVTITDATPGAVIYFTTDGSTPTTASQKYSGPFTVTVSGKVQAIAVLDNSAVASADFTIVIPPPPPPVCPSAGTVWKNIALPSPQSSNFSVEFDSTPSAVNIDSVLGLANGPVTTFGALSMGVRFHTSGNIDAISGTGYTPVQVIPYVAGQQYHFKLDVLSGKYTASVDSKVIGANLPFRAAATTISHLTYEAEIGAATVCNLKVSSITPPPIPVVFVTTTIPAATSYGALYTTILTASGGTAPYSWSATGLPTGITVSSTGVLSGTATVGGTFSVTVTDAKQVAATATFTLVVPAKKHSVTLTWNASTSSGVTSYNVYRGGVKIGNSTTTSFVDSNISAGANYCYTLTAVAGNSESVQSAQVCVTVPTP